MPTLGEELRRRREDRGKTLSGISETTHIVTRFLKAIEDDKFSVLPGGIFTRAFIRAYAREVGMDEAEAITLYYQETSPQETLPQRPSAPNFEAAAEPIVEDRNGSSLESTGPTLASPSPGSSSQIKWPIVATVLAIVALAGVIILVVSRINNEQASDSQAASTVARQQARPVPHGAATPAVPQQSGPVPADSPIAAASIQVISVKVEATGGQCWVKYQVDDGQHTSMMLEEGQSHSLPDAQNKVILDIGNRKALTIKINNHEVTFPPNTPNFSAHVIISRDNLQNYLQTAATHSF